MREFNADFNLFFVLSSVCNKMALFQKLKKITAKRAKVFRKARKWLEYMYLHFATFAFSLRTLR